MTLCEEPILLILKSSLGFKIKHGFHKKSVQIVWKLCDHCHWKDRHLPFDIPMIWSEQSDHVADCYFCMVNVKGFNKENKRIFPYPNFNSAIRPIPHFVDEPKAVFNYLPDVEEDDTLRYASTSTDDDMSVDTFSKSCWLLPPSLFHQAEIIDLIPDLNLPKQWSELLASRLQEKHLFHPGSNITFYRNRE